MNTLTKKAKKLAKINFIVKEVLSNYTEYGYDMAIKVVNRQRVLQGLERL